MKLTSGHRRPISAIAALSALRKPKAKIRFFFTILMAALAVFSLTTTASASTAVYTPYKYHHCANPGGGDIGHEICVAWTGGYPGGKIRVESAGATLSDIRLDTCSGTWSRLCDGMHTVASKALNGASGTTPSVSVGKYAWYEACSKTNHGGRWGCFGSMDDIYLGD